MINIKEVQGMLDTEYNEAEVMELFARDAQNKGIEIGINGTVNILRGLGLSENDIISKICEQYNLTQEQAQNYMS